MRTTSTPIGSFASLAFTAAATAASQLRGDVPVASVTRTTDAGEGLRRRPGICSGGAGPLCGSTLGVAIRRGALRLDRWERRQFQELVQGCRDPVAEHLSRL